MSANPAKWYVATMNDCIFIVNRKPRPAPVDHVNPNTPAPGVVISMRSGSREVQRIAEEITEAHNATVAALALVDGPRDEEAK